MSNNVTSFAYYYYRKYQQVPLPQIALDFQQVHGMTFADMVLLNLKEQKK